MSLLENASKSAGASGPIDPRQNNSGDTEKNPGKPPPQIMLSPFVTDKPVTKADVAKHSLVNVGDVWYEQVAVDETLGATGQSARVPLDPAQHELLEKAEATIRTATSRMSFLEKGLDLMASQRNFDSLDRFWNDYVHTYLQLERTFEVFGSAARQTGDLNAGREIQWGLLTDRFKVRQQKFQPLLDNYRESRLDTLDFESLNRNLVEQRDLPDLQSNPRVAENIRQQPPSPNRDANERPDFSRLPPPILERNLGARPRQANAQQGGRVDPEQRQGDPYEDMGRDRHRFDRRQPESVDLDEADAFYTGLPAPWNVPPRRVEKPGNIYQTMMYIPKFNGTEESYIPWRNSFTIHVHGVRNAVTQKFFVLLSTLTHDAAKNPRVSGLIRLEHSPHSYALALTTLEAEFGGQARARTQAKRRLHDLKPIRSDDTNKLRLFHITLNEYLQLLRASNLNVTELIFSEVFQLLTVQSGDDLLLWMERNRQPYSAQAISSWALELIDRSRKLEQLFERKTSRHAPPPPPAPKPFARPQTKPSFFPSFMASDPPPETEQLPVGGDSVEDDLVSLEKELDSCAVSPSPYEESDPEDLDVVAMQAKVSEKLCPVCQKQSHLVRDCPDFRKLEVKARRERARKLGLCYSCLTAGCSIQSCPTRRLCPKPLCKRSHHILLHDFNNPLNSKAFESKKSLVKTQSKVSYDSQDNTADLSLSAVSPMNPEARAFPCNSDCNLTRISLMTIPVRILNPTTLESVVINCLIDTGCTNPLLAPHVADTLGLKGPPIITTIQGVSGLQKKQKSSVVTFFIQSLDQKFSHRIQATLLDNPAGDMCPVNWESQKVQYPHLRQLPVPPPVLDVNTSKPDRVSLILGVRFPELFHVLDERKAGDGMPAAVKLPIGWAINGPYHPIEHDAAPEQQSESSLAFKSVVSFDAYMPGVVKASPYSGEEMAMMRQLFDIDKFPKDDSDELVDSPMQTYARKLLEESTVLKDGRYEVSCLWRPGEPDFPDSNYESAKRRLMSLERSKPFQIPEVKEAYSAKFRDWLAKAYIEELPPSEHGKGSFYIPHFCIFRNDKSTSKIRPVLDAADPGRGGKSLNSAIHPGPNLLLDLPTVLTKMRRHPVMVAADISEMFLQVRLNERDRDFHRFLWREDPSLPIREFRCLRHAFGNAGSPAVAIHVIREAAKEFGDRYPLAVETINSAIIMDDAMTSCRTSPEGVDLIEGLGAIYGKAGMSMSKVISSHSEVLKQCPPSIIHKEVHIRPPPEGATGEELEDRLDLKVKTLGVVFSADNDEFSFALPKDDKKPESLRKAGIPAENNVTNKTQRGVLSSIGRIYDPVGLVAPVLLPARLVYQKGCRLGIAWDQSLPPDLLEEWKSWYASMQDFESLRFNRCLIPDLDPAPHLLIFVDASSSAYGCVAYVQSKSSAGGPPHMRLAGGKSRVTPIRETSIPRLELVACLEGVRLANWLLKGLADKKLTITASFFSDSSTALSWLSNKENRLCQFVHNRVRKILSKTQIHQWFFVGTKHNPADIASRGIKAGQLEESLWMKGPTLCLDTAGEPSLEGVIPLRPKDASGKQDAGAKDSRDQSASMFASTEIETIASSSREVSLGAVSNTPSSEHFQSEASDNTFKSMGGPAEKLSVDRATGGAILPFHEGFKSMGGPAEKLSVDRATGGVILPFHEGFIGPRDEAYWSGVSKGSPWVEKVAYEKESWSFRAKTENNFSAVRDWGLALRAIARIKSALGRPSLSPEHALIFWLQNEAFGDLKKLLRKGPVPHRHPLAHLMPFLDELGLIRLNGRLNAMIQLDPDSRTPLLLHPDHPLTERLLYYLHAEVLKHAGGPRMLIARFLAKFWCSGLTNIAQKVCRCLFCFRHNARAVKQAEAPLPLVRAPLQKQVVPFQSLALDIGGPFEVSEGRGRAKQKRYMLLLNCLSCRAVHLEMLHSMTTGAMLNALERFCALRRKPSYIFSDNGLNFQGSKREIDQMLQEVAEKPQFREVRWDFAPPYTPQVNGVSERLIGAAKRALRTVLSAETFDQETLQTALAIVMGLLNSRPIGPFSIDPRDGTPLTPNHFLLGEPYEALGPTPEREWTFSKEWLNTKRLESHLWVRFVSEFLPSLHGYKSWGSRGKKFEVGDVVCTLDKRVRGKWPLAVIERIYESPLDGIVRSFDLRDASGKIHRRSARHTFRLDPLDDLVRGGQFEDGSKVPPGSSGLSPGEEKSAD